MGGAAAGGGLDFVVGITGGGDGAGGEACRAPLATKVRIRATSSSVRLANADPLPEIPARLQTSTSSLLSSFSSLARA